MKYYMQSLEQCLAHSKYLMSALFTSMLLFLSLGAHHSPGTEQEDTKLTKTPSCPQQYRLVSQGKQMHKQTIDYKTEQ